MWNVRRIEAVLPGREGAQIWMGEEEYLVPGASPKAVVEWLLLREGSDLDAARRASRLVLGSRYKLPVRLGGQALFPLGAVRDPQGGWIGCRRLTGVRQRGMKTRIRFQSGREAEVPLGARSVKSLWAAGKKYEERMEEMEEQDSAPEGVRRIA